MELKEMIYNNVKVTLLIQYKDNYNVQEDVTYKYFLNGFEVKDLTTIKPIHLEIFELLKKYN
jgi:hypothetical protein